MDFGSGWVLEFLNVCCPLSCKIVECTDRARCVLNVHFSNLHPLGELWLG